MENRIAVCWKALGIIILISLTQIPIYFMQQYTISIIGDDYLIHLQSRAIGYINRIVDSVQEVSILSANKFDNYQFVLNTLNSSCFTFALAFLWLFVIDIFKQAKLSWINYLIVAIGLVLFYLLELVLASYWTINLFYFIAAAVCTILLIGYLSGALKSVIASVLYGIGLVLIFALTYYLNLFISSVAVYVTICLFALFIVIVTMTRKINWHERMEVTKGSAKKLN